MEQWWQSPGGEQRNGIYFASWKPGLFIYLLGGGGHCRRATWVVFPYPIAGYFYCQIRQMCTWTGATYLDDLAHCFGGRVGWGVGVIVAKSPTPSPAGRSPGITRLRKALFIFWRVGPGSSLRSESCQIREQIACERSFFFIPPYMDWWSASVDPSSTTNKQIRAFTLQAL